MDFRPLGADDLQARARQSLVVAILVAVLLVASAVLISRQQARAAASELDLERHRHLASLGQMSAVLAHEIRNPLAALKGHAQLLAELLPGGQPPRDRADRVVVEAWRLEHLTDSLLDFARSTTVERAPTDPAVLLRAAAEDLGSDRIQLDLGRAPASWSLDPTRLRQVLVNLLRNALQAAPDAAVQAAVFPVGAELVFEVRDHGPGVPEDEREQIFAPFHTGRSQGTGLGLAVCRRLVELHHGRLEVSEHPQGGALFTASIPGA